ncbi:MAG: carboxyl transferase domain-containing protein, partial [Pseudomonadota bacterium]
MYSIDDIQGRDLFSDIERRAQDLSLNDNRHPFKWHQNIDGLISPRKLEATRQKLRRLNVDDYVAQVLDQAESVTRPSARSITNLFKGKIHSEFELGPLYSVELTMQYGDTERRIGIIAQDRQIKNGVWGPEHHLEACRLVASYNSRAIPIVTFMDTPGADAGTEANAGNQAHSISRLIAFMAAAKVPSIGIIYGLGYSGGAIPLATTNLVFAVRHAAFNTIQPKGLANIARQYNLSWQESARYVGVSPPELYRKGVVDGVIDWDPSDENALDNHPDNLAAAIMSGIGEIELSAKKEVLENPLISAHYLSRVRTEKMHKASLEALQKAADFSLDGELSEYPNVYSHALMYLRSIGMRCRIHSATIERYGRLADEEIPKGDLDTRTAQIREASFQQWLNDPEKLVYHDQLSKSWETLKQRLEEVDFERNKITALILGDPQSNYRAAQKQYCFVLCLYLYNRWKSEAPFNFAAMGKLIEESTSDDSA